MRFQCIFGKLMENARLMAIGMIFGLRQFALIGCSLRIWIWIFHNVAWVWRSSFFDYDQNSNLTIFQLIWIGRLGPQGLRLRHIRICCWMRIGIIVGEIREFATLDENRFAKHCWHNQIIDIITIIIDVIAVGHFVIIVITHHAAEQFGLFVSVSITTATAIIRWMFRWRWRQCCNEK